MHSDEYVTIAALRFLKRNHRWVLHGVQREEFCFVSAWLCTFESPASCCVRKTIRRILRHKKVPVVL